MGGELRAFPDGEYAVVLPGWCAWQDDGRNGGGS